jgi:SAM-dependent methyltransferase
VTPRPRPSDRHRRRPARRTDHVRTNRALWERQSDAYDRRFRSVLGEKNAESWGFERIPEVELNLLGPVEGRDILELGCGAARWSISLAGRGANVVGLDFSSAQLEKARKGVARARSPVRLIEASAERVPLRSASFDLVFCDWGAMTFCDPYRTVPECSRLLRPGGLLVFATASPIASLAWNRAGDRIGTRFTRDYFGLHQVELPNEVNFQLPYGGWIDLFRSNGFEVVSLLEPQMGRRRRSRYLSSRESRWGERWPLEAIWRVRKLGTGSPAPP